MFKTVDNADLTPTPNKNNHGCVKPLCISFTLWFMDLLPKVKLLIGNMANLSIHAPKNQTQQVYG